MVSDKYVQRTVVCGLLLLGSVVAVVGFCCTRKTAKGWWVMVKVKTSIMAGTHKLTFAKP